MNDEWSRPRRPAVSHDSRTEAKATLGKPSQGNPKEASATRGKRKGTEAIRGKPLQSVGNRGNQREPNATLWIDSNQSLRGCGWIRCDCCDWYLSYLLIDQFLIDCYWMIHQLIDYAIDGLIVWSIDGLRLIDWLIDRSNDWSIDWLRLIHWSADWSIDWLIDWSIDRWIDCDWSIDRLIDWSISWWTDRLIDWLNDCSTDRLIDWSIDRLIDQLIDWSIDRLIDWLNDWSIDRSFIRSRIQKSPPPILLISL